MALSLLLALFAACQDATSQGGDASGWGEVRLSMQLPADAPPMGVLVFDEQGKEVRRFLDLSMLPSPLSLPLGRYRISLQPQQSMGAGFGQLPYQGQTGLFEVAAGKPATPQVSFALPGVRLALKAATGLRYALQAKAGTDVLAFSEQEGRTAYFPAAETLLLEGQASAPAAMPFAFKLTGLQPGMYCQLELQQEGGRMLLKGMPQGVQVQELLSVQKPAYVTSQGFFVKDGGLYDANGVRFLMRGVNNPHFWYDGYGRYEAYNALTAIASLKANTVRIVWQASWKDADWKDNIAKGDTEAAMLSKIIGRCVQLGMVPMVELHDATGKTDKESMLALARYYTRPDILAVLQQYERYLLVNIANEWSGSGETYRQGYQEAVALMRAAGIRHTIVIDANGWGQNMDALLTYGPGLLEQDPEHNLLFSTHMYELWDTPTRVKDKLKAAKDLGLPMIVGEFGFQHGSPVKAVAWEAILQACQDNGQGYLGWSWKGNGGGVEYLDLSEDWAGKSLTTWGNNLFYHAQGIDKTARPATVFNQQP